jgi:hypothetical protein
MLLAAYQSQRLPAAHHEFDMRRHHDHFGIWNAFCDISHLFTTHHIRQYLPRAPPVDLPMMEMAPIGSLGVEVGVGIGS